MHGAIAARVGERGSNLQTVLPDPNPLILPFSRREKEPGFRQRTHVLCTPFVCRLILRLTARVH